MKAKRYYLNELEKLKRILKERSILIFVLIHQERRQLKHQEYIRVILMKGRFLIMKRM
jgi:hypothetical protein